MAGLPHNTRIVIPNPQPRSPILQPIQDKQADLKPKP